MHPSSHITVKKEQNIPHGAIKITGKQSLNRLLTPRFAQTAFIFTQTASHCAVAMNTQFSISTAIINTKATTTISGHSL